MRKEKLKPHEDERNSFSWKKLELKRMQQRMEVGCRERKKFVIEIDKWKPELPLIKIIVLCNFDTSTTYSLRRKGRDESSSYNALSRRNCFGAYTKSLAGRKAGL